MHPLSLFHRLSTDRRFIQFLFTAGMTIVDSADSILMLYAYAGAPDKSWSLFEKNSMNQIADNLRAEPRHEMPSDPVVESGAGITPDKKKAARTEEDEQRILEPAPEAVVMEAAETEESSVRTRALRVKHNTMSSLSIALTLVSILVAFR